MMILISKLTSEYRGGHHGEKTASYDGEKKQQEVGRKGPTCEGTWEEPGEDNEGQDSSCSQRLQGEVADRQSQHGVQGIDEGNAKPVGGSRMTADTSNLPKTGGQVARVAGQIFNDTRITNVLMLVLVLIGMGGAEAGQQALCSL